MKETHILHHSHHHNLNFEFSTCPFQCEGCKMRGFGYCYTCRECNFHLHEDCARPENPICPTLFRSRCKFGFRHRPPNNKPCVACLQYVEGWSYRSTCKTYNLHPFCANLPHTLKVKEKEEDKLILKLTDLEQSKCLYCDRKEQTPKGAKGWSYVSTCQNYCIHVNCIMKMIHDAWKKVYFRGNAGKNTGFSSLQIPKESLKSKISRRWSAKFRMVVSVFKVIISAILGYPIGEITTEIISLAQYLASSI